jgi:hypothetical protein
MKDFYGRLNGHLSHTYTHLAIFGDGGPDTKMTPPANRGRFEKGGGTADICIENLKERGDDLKRQLQRIFIQIQTDKENSVN